MFSKLKTNYICNIFENFMQEKFRQKLLAWYASNQRDLPWRKTKDPYFVWLSEIILQQTRIEQGLPYFYRFSERFPDIYSLAAAREDEVMRLWQGLGYYSRARNLQLTAKLIAERYHGVFPDNYKELRKLKGIGDYTASLIASVCFNQPYAVLDGNVFRVLSRIHAESEPINTLKGKQKFQRLADLYLDKNNPGDFNQGLMELGALICRPKNPACHICPVSDFCRAFKNQRVGEYPVKLPKEKLKDRYLNFIFIEVAGFFLIEKRKQNDIWKSLYQLPLVEKLQNEPVSNEEVGELTGLKVEKLTFHSEIKHLLTHRRLHISFYLAEIREKPNVNEVFLWVQLKKMNEYAFPKPIKNFLDLIIKKEGLNRNC